MESILPGDNFLRPDFQLLARGYYLLQELVYANTKMGPTFHKTHSLRTGELIPPAITGPSIYIVRDPRDVYVSYCYHNSNFANAKGTAQVMLDDGAHIIRDDGIYTFMGRWDNHVKSWMTFKPALVVKYEDIMADTISAFRAIIKHVDPGRLDDKKIEAAVDACHFSKLQAQEEARGFREKVSSPMFFREGKARGWGNRDVSVIEDAFAPLMKELGYE